MAQYYRVLVLLNWPAVFYNTTLDCWTPLSWFGYWNIHCEQELSLNWPYSIMSLLCYSSWQIGSLPFTYHTLQEHLNGVGTLIYRVPFQDGCQRSPKVVAVTSVTTMDIQFVSQRVCRFFKKIRENCKQEAIAEWSGAGVQNEACKIWSTAC